MSVEAQPQQAQPESPAPANGANPATPQTPVTPKPPLQRALEAWDRVRAEQAERAKAQTPPPQEKPAEKPAVEAKPEAKPPAAVEAKPAETPAEKPAEKPPEEPLSAKFAKVARLEQQAREALKSAKAKEESLTKREAEWKAKLEAVEAKRAQAKLNPLAWLEEAGISYDEATQYVLNGKAPTPEAQTATALRRVEELEKRQAAEAERSRKEAEESTRLQHQARYSAWASGVVDFVKANSAKYELINSQGKFELVPAVIQKHFEDKQAVLSEAEAADLVEKHLEDEAEKAFSAKKFQERFKQAPPVQPESAQPRTTTLNNSLTASSAPRNGSTRPLTWEERKQKALLAMEGASKT